MLKPRNPHTIKAQSACPWCSGTGWFAYAVHAEADPHCAECDDSPIGRQVTWRTCRTCQGTGLNAAAAAVAA